MIPERFATKIYGVFRLVFGFSFLLHGLQKWGLVGGPAVPLEGLMGGAKVIEPICGTLIMLGLFTSPAAFIACGQMAVVYFVIHFGPNGGFPIQNGGELAVLYCFAFLYIASRGGGYASVDGMLARTKK